MGGLPVGAGLGLELPKEPGLLPPGENGDVPVLEVGFGWAPNGFGLETGTLPIRCPVKESNDGSQINSN